MDVKVPCKVQTQYKTAFFIHLKCIQIRKLNILKRDLT